MEKKYFSITNSYLTAFFFFVSLFSFGQSTQLFPSSGTFIVPAGVTSITVQAWGGGGAGGGSNNAAFLSARGGGGGGGGAFVSGIITVVPNQILNITVGAGGVGSLGGNGGNGTASTITGYPVSAAGGLGGQSNPGGSSGGVGGSLAASVGATRIAGITGENGDTGFGIASGAGGASANSGGAGGTAITSGTNNGNSGDMPGGGGSGARTSQSGGSRIGGSGGAGRVVLSWACPSYSLSSTIAVSTVCTTNRVTLVTLSGSATSLPVGTYSVAYSLSFNGNSTTYTAPMTVTTAGTGQFTADLGILGANNSTTIRVSNLASGTCNNSITTNNVSNTVNVYQPITPTAFAGFSTCSGWTAQWQNDTFVSGYFLDVATTNTFNTGTFVPGFENLNVGNVISYPLTGLTAGITYYYRVRNNNLGCGVSVNSNVTSFVAGGTSTPVLGTITQPSCTTSTGSFTISNFNAANSYTFSPSAGITRSGANVTANPGNYTITATNGGCTSAVTNFTINPVPVQLAAPTIGTRTQPTCSTPTGSVVLNNLPAGQWSVNTMPGNVTTTGSGTTTTISGLAPGSYTFMVTDLGKGLQGTYFNTVDLTGPAVLTRTDATVDFNWGGSPGPGVNADDFSVRWTGTVEALYTEAYIFETTSDDGIRLWVNGAQIINNWTIHGATDDISTPINLVAGTKYNVVLEFFERGGGATSRLRWRSPSQIEEIIPQARLDPPVACSSVASTTVVINPIPIAPAAPAVGTITQPTCTVATGSVVLNGLPSTPWVLTRLPGNVITTGTGASTTITNLAPNTYTFAIDNLTNGLKGEYYNNVGLTGTPTLIRTDAVIDNNYGTGSPSAAIGNDNFSIRWSGFVEPAFTETYTFRTNSDDGIRLRVNGVQVINNWTDHGPTIDNGTISLVAGTKYEIVLEYYERGVGAVAQLSWLSASQALEIIPQNRLFSAALCGNNTSGNVLIGPQPIPVVPTLGTITQPTCAVQTGSIALSSLPSSGTWTITASPATSGLTGLSGSGTTTTIGGLVQGQSYTFTVSNGTCSSLATGSAAINSLVTTTYNGSSWTSPPTIAKLGVITSATASPITLANNTELCSCTISPNTNVIVNTGITLKLQNELNVSTSGSITFENASSLVQVNDAAVNSGVINYKRITSVVRKASDYTYWSSPVIGQNLLAVSPNTNLGRFWSFVPGGTWFVETPSTKIMDVAKGYIIRAPEFFPGLNPPSSTFVATFSGAPNNGVKTIAVGGPGTFNLIGNPYPSAIDAIKFLNANSTVLGGTIYFWTHNTEIRNKVGTLNEGSGDLVYIQDDYASFNRTGGVGTVAISDPDKLLSNPNIPNGMIAAGQSFFTTSIAAAGTPVTFNNDMRIGTGYLNNSQFFRTKETEKVSAVVDRSRIWLNLTNKQNAFKQTLVGYIDGATNDFDAAFDGPSFNANAIINFYSVNKSTNYVIQGRALPFEQNDLVPLGYSSTIDGEFSISIDNLDGLFTTQNVFLEDKNTNTIHNLKTSPYSFQTTKGTFNDRFVLRYTDKTLGVEDVITDFNTVLVTVKNKQLKVTAGKEDINSVVIYSILGKQIYFKKDIANKELVIENLPSSDQVLIVKTVLEDGTLYTTKTIFK
ncbi:PA14 domain-containing protein [Flavobacterium turcicum]|uniref:PA14 domain-containing protein n=1 Tax=Flavobacterium turcicum TaxID=2764718 RepID=A0ABR7JC14_9FLAO|nr:PA14 domain-containing protein [Flavobacterium turcicum]MBC5861806.1 hypothetical protein [Flavobacterium turcicum]NHL00537.1 hypothetical protein [Flavobacterium turcicum]